LHTFRKAKMTDYTRTN